MLKRSPGRRHKFPQSCLLSYNVCARLTPATRRKRFARRRPALVVTLMRTCDKLDTVHTRTNLEPPQSALRNAPRFP